MSLIQIRKVFVICLSLFLLSSPFFVLALENVAVISNDIGVSVRFYALNDIRVNTRIPKTDLIPHAPILITSDSGFSDFPGLGTPEDPYRIENYHITSTEFDGIHIADTTNYFKIQNCFIEVGDHRGIHLNNVGVNRTIIDNNTIFANYGIVIQSSSESNITDNHCIGSGTGIRVYYSDFSYIINNTFSGFSEFSGINIDQSNDCLIEKNYCKNNFHGILVSLSTSNTIYNNTCSNSSATEIMIYGSPFTMIAENICKNSGKNGIYLFNSASSVVENNLLYNSDLLIKDQSDDYSSLTVQNNMVNDKKIGFFVDETDIIFNTPEYGKLILINCNNVNISNQNFSNLSYDGIHAYYCSNLVIENNLFDDIGCFGIWALETPNLIINNNYISTSLRFGQAISFEACDQALITGNNFTDNAVAISIAESDSTIISTNNLKSSTDCSIFVKSSNETTIYNNTCDNHYIDGLEGTGIFLFESNFTQIEKNICYDFDEYGIWLRDSCFTDIVYNLIQNNFMYGIYIDSTSINNSIHHNTFHNNNLGEISQAYDDGINNTWFDSISLEGNYWSDYSGTGDYSIAGSAGSTDPYPLTSPLIPPIPEFSVQNSIKFVFLLIPIVCFVVISLRRKTRI